MANISARTRLVGSLLDSHVPHWLQPSLIKSIQTFTMTGATTQAITSVVMANTILLYQGVVGGGAGATTLNEMQMSFVLTNATLITSAVNAGANVGRVTAVEFVPGVIRLLQRGTITIANAVATNTATIAAVNTAKTWVNVCGWTTATADTANGWLDVVLTNSTTITATRAGTNGAMVVSYEAVQMW